MVSTSTSYCRGGCPDIWTDRFQSPEEYVGYNLLSLCYSDLKLSEFLQIYKGEDRDGWIIPKHRRPERKDVQNLFPAANRRRRLAKDAFEGLALFSKRNPENVYL